ncbi:hypothetical protein HYU16_01225 [Candidatus Woesearchaeota archaeon]|nr:hypothetical protein [Candidatus Woesearchaeota archaeon]
MKKRVNVIFALTLLLITVVAVSGCAQYAQDGGQQAPQAGEEAQPEAPAEAAEAVETQPPVASPVPEQPTEPQEQQQPSAAAGVRTVLITATGFNPQTLTIKAGETVLFLNQDTAQHWPASAVHPTHVVYPEPGGCIGSKFDSCKGLATGEPFMFTFNEKGSWKYHDHLNCCSDPAFFGTIVVE